MGYIWGILMVFGGDLFSRLKGIILGNFWIFGIYKDFCGLNKDCFFFLFKFKNIIGIILILNWYTCFK